MRRQRRTGPDDGGLSARKGLERARRPVEAGRGRPYRQVQPGTLPDGAQLSGVLSPTVLASRFAAPELT
ncbi:hypothetical protein JCM4914_10580 [Streptomyces platensis subsp. malvinus]